MEQRKLLGQDPAMRSIALQSIALQSIDETDTSLRFGEVRPVGGLGQSLSVDGQRAPVALLARGASYRIIDGFRRVAAARMLGWQSIEAMVHPPMRDAEARKIAFARNVIREDFSILEKAGAIRLARESGFPKADVAAMFGMSQRQIERYLAIPDGILRWIDGRTITMAHARVLADHAAVIPVHRMAGVIDGIRRERVSAHSLPRWLQGQGITPVVPVRRTRAPGHISPERVRFYNMELTPASPQETRQLTLDFLRRAIRQIEGFEVVAGSSVRDRVDVAD